MKEATITIKTDLLEGMLQYIQDEITCDLITAKQGQAIIENLIDGTVQDINLLALIEQYIEKYSG